MTEPAPVAGWEAAGFLFLVVVGGSIGDLAAPRASPLELTGTDFAIRPRRVVGTSLSDSCPMANYLVSELLADQEPVSHPPSLSKSIRWPSFDTLVRR